MWSCRQTAALAASLKSAQTQEAAAAAKLQEASARLLDVQQREETLKQELVRCAAARQAAEEEGEAAAKVSDTHTYSYQKKMIGP